MESIFQKIIDLSIMGSILTLVIFVLKALFRGRLSAFWQYTLWFLLILRLSMPVAPENGFSIYNLSKPITSAVQQQTANIYEVNSNVPQPDITDIPENQPAKEKSRPITNWIGSSGQNALPITDIAAIVWLVGALIMTLLIFISNVNFYGKMRYAIPCKDTETLNELASCHALACIKRKIQLYSCEAASVPLLIGVFRPRLIISPQILNHLSSEEKRHIFLHELIHYKRKDILINWVTALLKCIYWFNPLILYAFHKMSEDCELSCDESVLKKLTPSEYSRYGKTILSLAAMNCRPVALASASGLITKKSGVKRRIVMISKYKHKTVAATLLALTLTLLVGCSALTDAKEDRAENFLVSGSSPSATQNVSAQKGPDNSKEQSVEDQAKQLAEQIKKQGPELSVEEKVILNLGLLKDKTYTGTYGDGYTWYTAAEELGMIGKPAIPGLIQKLDTEDDYERALVLYALLLATQHESVKNFTSGEYIDVNLDFNPESHPAMVEKAKAWWEKYKDQFLEG